MTSEVVLLNNSKEVTRLPFERHVEYICPPGVVLSAYRVLSGEEEVLSERFYHPIDMPGGGVLRIDFTRAAI